MGAFEQAMERLFPIEAGYVNDPLDSGGETKYGISKHAYPDEDIPNLTRDRAMFLYKRDFWDKIQGDSLPFVIADQLLDFAINAGISTSIRKAQETLGLADDGYCGPVTKTALTSANPGIFTAKFAAKKIRFYTSLSSDKFQHDGAGWMNRIAQDLDYAAGDMK